VGVLNSDSFKTEGYYWSSDPDINNSFISGRGGAGAGSSRVGPRATGLFPAKKSAFVLLLSCMGDEVSLETRGVRQGVFLFRGPKGESNNNKDKMARKN
jgi:hypothetical protein